MSLHVRSELAQQTETLPLDTTPFVPENETEVLRQLLLHEQLSKQFRGPLPRGIPLHGAQRVLDVGCGVGGWLQEMARCYPEAHLVGIDKSAYSIKQARSFVQPGQHISYEVQDMYQLPQTFPANSFDLVHLRFLLGAMTYHHLPTLTHAIAHVCRNKAYIVWHESELPLTTSKACDELCQLVLLALRRTGRHFSYSRTQQLGIMEPMIGWLQQEGFEISHTEIAQVEVSVGMPMHEAFVRQAWVFGHQVRSFLLQTEVVTGADFEALFLQVQREVREPYFCGVCPQHLFIARKR